jgi:hypothetical protein
MRQVTLLVIIIADVSGPLKRKERSCSDREKVRQRSDALLNHKVIVHGAPRTILGEVSGESSEQTDMQHWILSWPWVIRCLIR